MSDLLRQQLAAFLAEDRVGQDITSRAVIKAGTAAQAVITAQAPGVAAGLREALVLADLTGVDATARMADGDPMDAGTEMLRLRGPARALLGLERTLLNVLSHMSGIATRTRRAVRAVEGTGTRIAATRKTLPGLRDLGKRAVELGGGVPHRRDLSAAVLIKDNHLAFAASLSRAVADARAAVEPGTVVEVEVETVDDAVAGARAGADVVMLDNMPPAQVRAAVQALLDQGLRGAVQMECSGGITPANVRDYAEAGADVVSMGALTMSSPALDINLALVETTD